MAATDAGGAIAGAALRAVAVVVAVFAALMVWFAVSALAGPAESSRDAILQGAVSMVLALVALAVLVVYAAGDPWIARSRSGGRVGRVLRASPLLAVEAVAALAVVVLWPGVGALGQSELVDTGTLEAAWLGAAVAWLFCVAVVLQAGQASLRRLGTAGVAE